MRTEEEIAEKFKIGRSSAKLYLRNYEKISKKLTDDEMKDADKIINTFDKLKPNTLRTYILSVMRVLDLDEEEMDKLGKAYVKITREIEDKRISKKIDVPDIDFKRKLRMINDKINDTRSESKLEQLLQDKLIILIHSEIPVRRAMDWYDMEIVPEKTKEILDDKEMEGNYYNMRDFIFKKYKTAKTHGTQVVKPTKRIKRTATMLLDIRGDDIGDYLFMNRSGNKFTNPSWNKTLQRVLGVSTNTLRKVYIKQNVDTEAVRKAMELAESMGHTIETAEREYYEKDGEPKNERTKVEDAE